MERPRTELPIIVQKYGGTSLADPQLIIGCARRAVDAHLAGNRVVVIVSAMGHTTDELIELAGAVTPRPIGRELDVLLTSGEQISTALMALAIQSLSVQSVSLVAQQLDLRTTGAHGRATIRSIRTERILQALEQERIVIVPGFQGITDDGDITTLGRGGSDITAVAIAAALEVRKTGGVCEIYTDVDGVYTGDPRYVPNARKIAHITYAEMQELASLGAGVLHARSALCGRRYDVPIHVRHSAKPDPGTIITKESDLMEEASVVGCAVTEDLGRVSVRGLPNKPGVQAVIFEHIGKANILVDDIMQTQLPDTAHVSFTVPHSDLADTKVAVQSAIEAIGQGEIAIEVGLAKVSAVGLGMRTHTGVAARMFQALGDAGIPIANITTSEINISCLVPKERCREALRVVHDAFNLGEVNSQQQQHSMDDLRELATPARR